jgi:hypothetical protein
LLVCWKREMNEFAPQKIKKKTFLCREEPKLAAVLSVYLQKVADIRIQVRRSQWIYLF